MECLDAQKLQLLEHRLRLAQQRRSDAMEEQRQVERKFHAADLNVQRIMQDIAAEVSKPSCL